MASHGKRIFPLYKYLKENRALEMINKGSIRIGSVYEYRKYDNKEIGDQQEGNYRAGTTDVNGFFTNNSQLPGAVKHFLNIQGNSRIELKNVNVFVPQESPDANIFCMTSEPSKAVMHEFGADACVEIIDAIGFQEALTTALTNLGYCNGHSVLNECTYVGREVDYHSHPAVGYWLKDQEYLHQKEVRLVFDVNHRTLREGYIIEPRVLVVPEIKPFLKLHEF